MSDRSDNALQERPAMVGATIAFVLFGVIVALVRAGKTENLDKEAMRGMQRHRTPSQTRLMRLISWAGFEPQSRLIPPAIAGVLWLRGFRREAKYQLLAWGASFISFLVKRFMQRPRPDKLEFHVEPAKLDQTSFPSGHVLNYVGVYGFLVYLIHRLVPSRLVQLLLIGPLVGLISFVGHSRIYLGHHWLTDVLASYCLGSGYLLTVISLYRRAVARGHGK